MRLPVHLAASEQPADWSSICLLAAAHSALRSRAPQIIRQMLRVAAPITMQTSASGGLLTPGSSENANTPGQSPKAGQAAQGCPAGAGDSRSQAKYAVCHQTPSPLPLTALNQTRLCAGCHLSKDRGMGCPAWPREVWMQNPMSQTCLCCIKGASTLMGLPLSMVPLAARNVTPPVSLCSPSSTSQLSILVGAHTNHSSLHACRLPLASMGAGCMGSPRAGGSPSSRTASLRQSLDGPVPLQSRLSRSSTLRGNDGSQTARESVARQVCAVL